MDYASRAGGASFHTASVESCRPSSSSVRLIASGLRDNSLRVRLLGVAFLCTVSVGCGDRPTTVVGSLASPDGQHVMWVTNEYGGLGSGVVSVHLAKTGEKPSPVNLLLSTPECTQTIVRWSGPDALEALYDTLTVTRFRPDRSPRIVLFTHRASNAVNVESPEGGISMPCDPY